MTVKELVAYLQTFPDHLQVAYRHHSEYCLMEVEEIRVVKAQPSRADGWIPDGWGRKDLATVDYLMFPGN